MRNSPQTTCADVPSVTASLLEKLRARRPRIHCVTNTVAQNFTANVLLAMGCVPSMTLSREEIGDFIAGSEGLLINLGTLDPERREAITIAIQIAADHKMPWVLDPVFVDRSAPRAAFVRELVSRAPNVVRLNHAEFTALADHAPSYDTVKAYASKHRTIIGLSGETDLVTDGERVMNVANGHPLMTKVTAVGCASSALVAACLAVESDAWRATAAALVILGIAGETAAATAAGPGSFAVSLIDVLYQLDAATVIKQTRVS
jgi:hydroxyethylthiazole kinase